MPGVEPLRILAREAQEAEGVRGAQRQERERSRRLAAVEPVARLEWRIGAAVGRAERIGVLAQLVRRRGQLGQVRLLGHFAPQPARHQRHLEVFLQAVVEHRERGLEIGRGEQRERRAVHLFADRVVLAAEANELPQPRLDLVVLLAQRHDLALGDGDRVAAVRMRNEDLGNDVGVVREEPRIRLQPLRDSRCIHAHFL